MRVSQALLVELGSNLFSSERSENGPEIRCLDWPSFEALLPDGGFPRGAVVELASPNALGGGALLGLLAIRAAQSKEGAFSAWLDPYATLYAPGVLRAGIDLARLLVVRPLPADLGRIAVKVVASGAFEVAVVEMAKIPGATASPMPARARGRRQLPPEVMVRKLALLAEQTGTTVILLSDSTLPRALPWPVALRLELARREGELSVRVAKDRRGRMSQTPTWMALDETICGGSLFQPTRRDRA